VPADAHDLPVVDEELLDGEFLADLDACPGRAVHEQLVENGAAWAVRDGRVGRAGFSGNGEDAEVEAESVDRRAPGRGELVAQAPPP
jgi:hypothetical protein